MKSIVTQIDTSILVPSQVKALISLNAIYLGSNKVKKIEVDPMKDGTTIFTYTIEVDEDDAAYPGDAFYREDFLCGVLDVLEDYK